MRDLVSRMFQRTILAWRSWNTAPTCSAVHSGVSSPFGDEGLLDLGLDGVDGGVALLLVGVLVGGAQVALDELQHVGFEIAE